MNKHGVKYIYLGPVDNVLLKLADPVSLGYMVKNDFDIVSHFLRKRSADEKVGLHMAVNGKIKILEYSETDAKVKESKDEKGEFVFAHGARATMYIKKDFVEKMTNDPDMMLNINRKYQFYYLGTISLRKRSNTGTPRKGRLSHLRRILESSSNFSTLTSLSSLRKSDCLKPSEKTNSRHSRTPMERTHQTQQESIWKSCTESG